MIKVSALKHRANAYTQEPTEKINDLLDELFYESAYEGNTGFSVYIPYTPEGFINTKWSKTTSKLIELSSPLLEMVIKDYIGEFIKLDGIKDVKSHKEYGMFVVSFRLK